MIDIVKLMTECKYRDKGREYPYFDCYGFTRYVYNLINGVDIIDFEYNKSNDKNNEIIYQNAKLTTNWRKVKPQYGAVIVLKVNGYVSHIGVMIDDRRFIHIMGNGGVKISGIQDTSWRNRIVGYYKYNA